MTTIKTKIFLFRDTETSKELFIDAENLCEARIIAYDFCDKPVFVNIIST